MSVEASLVIAKPAILPANTYPVITPNRCRLNNAQFLGVQAYPNNHFRDGQATVKQLGEGAQFANNVLTSKDHLGYSVLSSKSTQIIERARGDVDVLAALGDTIGAHALKSTVNYISRSYEAAARVESQKLAEFAEEAAEAGADLYVAFSHPGQIAVSRFAHLESFAPATDEWGIIRPMPIVADTEGAIGVVPMGYELNGLFLLAEK